MPFSPGFVDPFCNIHGLSFNFLANIQKLTHFQPGFLASIKKKKVGKDDTGSLFQPGKKIGWSWGLKKQPGDQSQISPCFCTAMS